MPASLLHLIKRPNNVSDYLFQMNLTLDQIKQAAERLRGSVLLTPCTHARTLSRIAGAEVFLKFENHQFTAAFKERGALNRLLCLSTNERRRGVIAMSAGNHAQAVAFHAKRLGILAVIVMPRHTPSIKVEHTRIHGAEVILQGNTFEESGIFAQVLAKKRKLILIHPYDDYLVMAGQGTIALEMFAHQPALETLIVPIGGGGLVAGMAMAAKGIKPEVEIIGVQTKRFPAMRNWLNRQHAQCGCGTVAEGIAVKCPGLLTRRVIKDLVDDILLVGENEIENAVLMFLQIEKTIVEGAGACGLAALLGNYRRFRNKKIGLVLSGGNIDLMTLSTIIQRGLAKNGQLVRLRVEVPDVPGELGRLTGLVGEAGGNIIEVFHQRTFSAAPVKTAEVHLVLQTRGLDHLAVITGGLNANGFRTLLPSGEHIS